MAVNNFYNQTYTLENSAIWLLFVFSQLKKGRKLMNSCVYLKAIVDSDACCDFLSSLE